MQLLRTILIIVIVYYVFRLFIRYVLPLLAKYFLKRTQKNYQKQYEKPKRKVGDITIEHTPEKKKELDNMGEYVDYEEIED